MQSKIQTNKQIAIYPGTFDPITNGHLDIIQRASNIFEHLIVAVAQSTEKNPKFSLQDRLKMVRDSIKNIKNVSAMGFSNLMVDFAKEQNSRILVRGLRAVGDFEHELQMGYANTSLNKNLETIYFMPSLQNIFISSTAVRSILNFNGEISHLVPKAVIDFIKREGND